MTADACRRKAGAARPRALLPDSLPCIVTALLPDVEKTQPEAHGEVPTSYRLSNATIINVDSWVSWTLH